MKHYYVDFYDMIDGWGQMPDFYPERQFDDFDEARALCEKLQSELAEGNKRCGEHYGVIDFQGYPREVFCSQDSFKRLLDRQSMVSAPPAPPAPPPPSTPKSPESKPILRAFDFQPEEIRS